MVIPVVGQFLDRRQYGIPAFGRETISTHQIHIFISHSWAYSEHYAKLREWTFDDNWAVGQASLDFHDYSVPSDDPIHNAPTAKELREAIYAKIKRSHVIIIPTGMYANYSKWIKKEIDGALAHEKPILAVNPMGQKRASSVVLENAAVSVGWNRKPLVNKVWNLYKG